MANVRFKRDELRKAEEKYNLIRDCLGGESVVKSRGTKYLPQPNENEDEVVASARYAAYLLRATFYGVTKRTLNGLCGQIFTRNPIINVPILLNPMVADVNGSSVDLIQLSKEAAENVIGYGRSGIFVDYPAVGQASREDIVLGRIRPTLHLFSPWQIINWRTLTINARRVLTLLVLEEEYETDDDGFELKYEKRWRVLRLVNGVYSVQLWKVTQGVQTPAETFIPLDASGDPLTEIPFYFMGALNNDSSVDEPPMYDIASLNIAHYRNSADYEESVFMIGQPTPVISGLTEHWVTNVLQGKVRLGSRGAIMLPESGSASLLQAAPNNLSLQAMQHKEKQMVALGARLVEQRNIERTLGEANQDNSTHMSILASVAKNVSEAFTRALATAARFVGASEEVSFSLNTDFDIATMSPEARRQLVEEWNADLLSWAEVRTCLRKSGLATEDDDTAKASILAVKKEFAVLTADTGADAPTTSGG